MLPDAINGTFELCGGVALGLSIARLYRDKYARGVHWGTGAFFTAWSLYNLFYYPHLGQWFSFAGGVVLATAQAVYLGMLLYYTRPGRALRMDSLYGIRVVKSNNARVIRIPRWNPGSIAVQGGGELTRMPNRPILKEAFSEEKPNEPTP